MIRFLPEDFRQKARWNYGNTSFRSVLKALVTDGSFTMVAYRVAQTCYRLHIGWLGAVLLKFSSVLTQALIGRGAEFGPGFVVLHSTGLVINGRTRGGRNVFLEHGVTIGEEKGGVPVLGSDIFVGAGAKIFGRVRIGDGARIGANAVVVHDVPDHSTAVGVPARILPPKRSKP
ncbi:MAG: serine acetyltransferase [Pseudomonadota bacterium]